MRYTPRHPPQSNRLWTPLLLGAALVLSACAAQDVCHDSVTRPDWWGYASHCPGAPADYTAVFDATRVRRFDFSIDPAVFAQGQADLESIVSAAGVDDLDAIEQPMWMSATLSYDSRTWTEVGFRWKGHASLAGAWSNHIGKLSIRVDVDHFDDVDPRTKHQRFFGFQGFALSNGYKDDSLIRDKTGADIFRAAGVPAPRGSFAQVYVDIGNGPFYLGMYTVIEKAEDQMLNSQVGNALGNLYKPWGDAARWPPIAAVAVAGASTSQAELESHFEKQTNESSDWSDVFAVINALYADRTDAAAWRANLEARFNVQAFLKWLAANQTMLNWDSYGCMTHNYYIYANPLDQGRFLWLPWDLNEALADRKHDGCVPRSVMLDEVVSRSSAVSRQWPLIEYLLGDATYHAQYQTYLRMILDVAFASDTVKAQMQADHDLIAPYVDGTISTENGAAKNALFTGWFSYQNTTLADFKTSLTRTGDSSTSDGLQVHVDKRRAAVEAALSAVQ